MLPTAWCLLPQVFQDICREYGCPLIDLFAPRANVKQPLYVSPIPDPMAWKEGAFQHSWDDLSVYAFPPFALLRQVLLRVLISRNLSAILVALLDHKRNGLPTLFLSEYPCSGTCLFSLMFGSLTGVWSCFVFKPGNYPATHPKGRFF